MGFRARYRLSVSGDSTGSPRPSLLVLQAPRRQGERLSRAVFLGTGPPLPRPGIKERLSWRASPLSPPIQTTMSATTTEKVSPEANKGQVDHIDDLQSATAPHDVNKDSPAGTSGGVRTPDIDYEAAAQYKPSKLHGKGLGFMITFVAGTGVSKTPASDTLTTPVHTLRLRPGCLVGSHDVGPLHEADPRSCRTVG